MFAGVGFSYVSVFLSASRITQKLSDRFSPSTVKASSKGQGRTQKHAHAMDSVGVNCIIAGWAEVCDV